MSRIEKALERAVQMRDRLIGPSPGDREQKVEDARPGREKALPPQADRPSDGEFGEFLIGESIIDRDLVERRIVCLTDPHSPVAEQYKKLKAKILRDTEKGFRNTIMVASAGIGEGKSVTAVNLAVSFANEIDHTVLLIDGDLRSPSVHRYLGLPNRPGLSEYLKGEAELPDLLVKTGIGKLVLLSAGKPPENPAELIASDRMKDLVNELKSRYKDRYIIFDSSPVLVTADALSLGNYVDGIVFVVQAEQTIPKAAAQALSLLKDNADILGVVFNNIPDYLASNIHSYYYYRYGNGNKGK